MSSTNRGGRRSDADQYPTPSWCVHRLLAGVSPPLPGGRWLEPAGGRGAIIRAVSEMRSDVAWTVCELLPQYERALGSLDVDVRIGDYFSTELSSYYDVVITNPPYRLAMSFLERSLELSDIVVMLLRVNFLASDRRSTWMRDHTPDVYVLPNRPSFTGKGTDSPEYAWFVFHGLKKKRSEGRLRVLESTSRAVRMAAAAEVRAAYELSTDEATKSQESAIQPLVAIN